MYFYEVINLVNLKKFVVVCGHYGCGKTNFSINLANYLINKGNQVTLIDFDIINPYFRSSAYIDLLKEKGIKLISPIYANSNLDLPAVLPEIYSVFLNKNEYAIFDVGGDAAGTMLLSRFSQEIINTNSYDMLYIINKYRKETSNSESAVKILKEIESASKLNATAIVNNSNLQSSTTSKDIMESEIYANEISKQTNLSVIMTTALDNISAELKSKAKNIFEIYMYVKPPWF